MSLLDIDKVTTMSNTPSQSWCSTNITLDKAVKQCLEIMDNARRREQFAKQVVVLGNLPSYPPDAILGWNVTLLFMSNEPPEWIVEIVNALTDVKAYETTAFGRFHLFRFPKGFSPETLKEYHR